MEARPGGFRPAVVVPAVSDRPGRVEAVQNAAADEQVLTEIDETLAELPDLLLADQVQVFAEIHQRLTTALAATGVQHAGEAPNATGAHAAGQRPRGR